MTFEWREWSLVHCCMFATFVVSSLFYDAVLAVTYVSIRPINVHLYRKIAAFCLWSIKSQLVGVGRQYSGSVARLECDRQVYEEWNQHHGIILMNHHYELDWMYCWIVAESVGGLGNGRAIVKKVLKYVPMLGWAWALTDFIFLDRNWDKDREALRSGMDVLSSYKDSVSLVLFPEGTRLNREKLLLGQEFSEARGLPVLQHHLVPRTKGFSHIMQHLDRSKFKYVYDVTLVMNESEGAAPLISNVLTGKKVMGDIYVRRIPTRDIPKEPEACSRFLFDLFADKDLLVESYLKSGGTSFTSELPECKKPELPSHERFTLEPSLGPLVNNILLNLLVGLPMVCLFLNLMLSGSVVQFALATGLVFGAHFTMKKFIGIGHIKQT